MARRAATARRSRPSWPPRAPSTRPTAQGGASTSESPAVQDILAATEADEQEDKAAEQAERREARQEEKQEQREHERAREERQEARAERREEQEEAREDKADKAEARKADQPETYTVKSGDTLGEIAARYGVNYMDIARANNIENPDLIFPGQVFKIPQHRPPVPSRAGPPAGASVGCGHAAGTHGRAGPGGRGGIDGAPARGTLMPRAATGLAFAVLDLLGVACTARRVRLLVGRGTTAATPCRPVWCSPAAWCAGRRGAARAEAHTEGLAALRADGGRVCRGRGAHHPRSWSTGSSASAVDQVCVRTRWWRWRARGGAGRRRRRAARGRRRHRPARGARERRLTVTFGTHKIAHLVDPAARACGAVNLVDIGLSLPEAAVETLQPADVAGMLPGPCRTPTSTPAASSAYGPGRSPYPAPPSSACPAPTGAHRMVRYAGPGGRPFAPAPRDRGLRRPGAGLGRRVRAVEHEEVEARAEALADGVPTVVDADALATSARPKGRVLTPHAGELARRLGSTREAVEAGSSPSRAGGRAVAPSYSSRAGGP